MTLGSIAKQISDRINAMSHTFSTEEDVRVKCEEIFSDVFCKAGINYSATKYEVKVKTGRIDALFNSLCIEYKAPGLVRVKFNEFVKEKAKYLPAIAEEYRTSLSQVVGILIDGKDIGFFREKDDGSIVQEGPYPISEQSISHLVTLVETTSKKALISKNILESFNSESPITKNLVRVLWDALLVARDTRTKMFFNEWRRLFGQVSSSNNGAEIVKDAKAYGIAITVSDASRFIFTLHTAYAFIIKNIALMVLQAKRHGLYQLADKIKRGVDVLQLAKEIEDDKAFKNLGIRNFLEGDYFCWYVLEWSGEIEAVFQSVVKELDQYEPQTASLKPEAIQDLMKELYEGLLSKKMRHSLGEYYTPDWLAEYTLVRSGYTADMKLLDPTCGSGTFLVTAIKKVLEQKKLVKNTSDGQLLQHIVTHIYGIDLNPLAVISARTNYILAIEPLLDYSDDIEIPVYLGDAIFSPTKASDGVYTYFLDTDNGRLDLRLPEELFQTPGLMAETLSQMDYYVDEAAKGSITIEQAVASLDRFLHQKGVPSECILDLLRKINDLEERKWDGIWCNIIKNYFSTVGQSDFDVIIGNPPWVRWSDLPTTYRNTIKDFCKSYGLFSSDKFFGGVESDISTMVLYSAADKWLRDGGTLAMLITRSVFKTESSEGFRMFRFPGTETKMCVSLVEDFTNLRPFDNAANKPSLVVLTKGSQETKYPLPWFVWSKSARIKSTDTLKDVMENTQRAQLCAHPVKGSGSPWLTLHEDRLQECLTYTGESVAKEYRGRKGICTDLNGLYFGSIGGHGLSGKMALFTNQFGTRGKTVDLSPVTVKLESELLYPIALGREIHPFCWDSSGVYGIVPQQTQKGYSEEEMLSRFPKSLSYFSAYKALLEERSSYKRYNQGAPFYSAFNVGEYSFAPYKVCWREISGCLQSCVLTEKDGKVVVPDHKIYFVPLYDEAEAYYLCGMLNTSIVNEIVSNYAESTQIGTHIFDYVNISKFNPANATHSRIAKISKDAHLGFISATDAKASLDALLHK